MRWVVTALLALGTASSAAAEVGPAMSPMLSIGTASAAAVHYDNERRSRGASTAAGGSAYVNPLNLSSSIRPGPSSTAAVSSLAYSPSSTDARTAEAAYLQRLRPKNVQAADALAAEMRKNDFSRVYATLVRPFGLSTANAADAVTAYMVLGYLIATGAPDPSAAAVRAARNQIAGGLSRSPIFANAATRRDLGEELKISFVTIHAGWQAARREGSVKAYSDGVARMFAKQSGDDLRNLVLTDAGFRPR